MTSLTYTGFRFEWSRDDVNSLGGKLKMHCLVVARSMSEAQQILEDTVTGSLVGVSLLSSGPDVLAEAKQQGLGEGQAAAL